MECQHYYKGEQRPSYLAMFGRADPSQRARSREPRQGEPKGLVLRYAAIPRITLTSRSDTPDGEAFPYDSYHVELHTGLATVLSLDGHFYIPEFMKRHDNK
jgi:hypothetical protein